MRLASALRSAPVDSAKTTSFNTIGGAGDTRSRDVHAGSSDSVPFWLITLKAAIVPLVTTPFAVLNVVSAESGAEAATSSQRTPSASRQVLTAPALKSAPAVE